MKSDAAGILRGIYDDRLLFRQIKMRHIIAVRKARKKAHINARAIVRCGTRVSAPAQIEKSPRFDGGSGNQKKPACLYYWKFHRKGGYSAVLLDAHKITSVGSLRAVPRNGIRTGGRAFEELTAICSP